MCYKISYFMVSSLSNVHVFFPSFVFCLFLLGRLVGRTTIYSELELLGSSYIFFARLSFAFGIITKQSWLVWAGAKWVRIKDRVRGDMYITIEGIGHEIKYEGSLPLWVKWFLFYIQKLNKVSTIWFDWIKFLCFPFFPKTDNFRITFFNQNGRFVCTSDWPNCF